MCAVCDLNCVTKDEIAEQFFPFSKNQKIKKRRAKQNVETSQQSLTPEKKENKNKFKNSKSGHSCPRNNNHRRSTPEKAVRQTGPLTGEKQWISGAEVVSQRSLARWYRKKLFITEFTRGPCLSRFQEVSALTVPSPTFENCYIILNSSSWAADLQPQPQ